MEVGVTGHQARPDIDWSWVAKIVRQELLKIGNVTKTFSSLAVGSDQVFAEIALGLNIPVVAVLPLVGYERYFHGEDLLHYKQLLGRSEPLQLGWTGDAEHAFLEAGK